MPTLNWIGKQAVIKHHQEVPYRLLEPVPELSLPSTSGREVGDEGAAESQDFGGNLIVQGDNLLALKALLPRYAGQVKCIYIDPPYNTGNEGWVYNDNVNSPEIRKWLGEVVGREGETLDRHDRWLCMMYPRIVLLREFLEDDGVMFCSIGKDEIGHARVLFDEIFGVKCHIETFIFVTEGNTENAEDVTSVHDYVLVYSKRPGLAKINITVDPNVAENSKLLRDFAENSVIKNGPKNPASIISLPIGFPCEADSLKLTKHSFAAQFLSEVDRHGGWIPRDFKARFAIEYPVRLDDVIIKDGKLSSACRVYSGWSSAAKFREFIDAKCLPIEDDGANLRFFLSKNGVPTYRRDGRRAHFVSTLLRNMGSTEKDKNELERMGLKFDYPKPRKLITYLLSLYTRPGDLVLDSFAGSGTTAHAALTMPAGHLRFILIEIDAQNASAVIAERLRKVISGYKEIRGQRVVEISPAGGAFQFCTLTKEPLFTAEGQIRSDVTFAQLAEFVWFKETGVGLPPHPNPLPPGERGLKSPLIGAHEGRAIYLLYNGILKDKSVNGGNVLTGKVLEALPTFDGPKVIYAAACRLGEPRLRREGIVFKQTPYALAV